MKTNYSITFEQINSDVLITAYERYSQKAITMNVNEYFLNSVSITELINTIKKVNPFDRKQKAQENSIVIDSKKEGATRKIVIPDRGSILYILVDNIICFEADRSYTYIFLKDGKKYVVSNRSLNEYEELLEGCNFFRTHRSHLINLGHIKKYHRNGVIHLELLHGRKIPVSRRKKSMFEKEMERHIAN